MTCREETDMKPPEQPAGMPDERSYVAFISYRHLPLDREAAVRIQKKIENYKVPKEFQDRAGGKKLGIVFRDEDELPASSSLSDSITYALDHSQFLIVICTPDLPQSRWCLQEIRYFLRTHDRDHILAVLADGSPEQSFPAELRFIYDAAGCPIAETEPLAANIAGPGRTIDNRAFKKEVVRLFAAMLDCPFDALWQREHRAKTNRLIAAMAAGLSVMAVIMGIVISKNAQIAQKNQELEQKISTALVDAGIAQLQNYDRSAALQNALDALESQDPDVYDHRAEKLLTDALGAYGHFTLSYIPLVVQTTDIENIAVTEDGVIAMTADRAGNIRAVDTGEGTILWDTFLNTAEAPALYPVGNGLVLCKTAAKLTALSTADGSTVWDYTYVLPNDFRVLSDDGTRIAVLDSADPGYTTRYNSSGELIMPDMLLSVLRTADGGTDSAFYLPDDPYHIYVNSTDAVYDYSGDFSDDNSRLAAALPTMQNGEQQLLVFLGAMEDRSLSVIGVYSGHPDMILGTKLLPENDAAYLAVTDGSSLYSVIMYADPDRDTVFNEINYSMSSPSGIAGFDYVQTERPFLPMLASDHLAVLFSRNTVRVIDLADATERYSLDLDSPIVSAVWLDRDREYLELFTQSGRYCTYVLTYGTDRALSGYTSLSTSVSDVTTACRCYTGSGAANSDYLLAVSSRQPGCLLAVLRDRDPDYQEGPYHDTSCAFAGLTPSGDRVMLFYPSSDRGDTALVETVSLADGTVCEQASIPLEPFFLPLMGLYPRPLITDDSHFLLYGILYGLDGSVELIGQNMYFDYQAAVLEDGRVLFAHADTVQDTTVTLPGWTALACYLDGVLQEQSRTVKDGLAFAIEENDARTHFAVGSNGWAAGWGRLLSPDAGSAGTASAAEEVSVAALYVPDGKKVLVEDSFRGTAASSLVLSNRLPYLACAYETGDVVLYQLDSNTSRQIPAAYARGEVRTMVFSDTDEYMLVLTAGGRVDGYRTDTLERVFSRDRCFAVSDSSLIDWFTAVSDPANSRLILTAANESGKTGSLDLYHSKYWTTVLDTASWEITAQPDDVCCWSPKHKKVYIVSGGQRGICKAHSLADLILQARKKLNAQQ